MSGADKLTDEEKVQFREAYKNYEQGGEGGPIKVEDVASVLRAAGQAPTEAEIEDYKKELDPRDSGEVDFQALLELYGRNLKSTLEMDDELTNALKQFDKEMDGYVTTADMRQYLTTLGEVLSPEEIDELIKDADRNGEGKISCSEFAYSMIHDFMA